jgi:AraC-like DNA-binding protein
LAATALRKFGNGGRCVEVRDNLGASITDRSFAEVDDLAAAVAGVDLEFKLLGRRQTESSLLQVQLQLGLVLSGQMGSPVAVCGAIHPRVFSLSTALSGGSPWMMNGLSFDSGVVAALGPRAEHVVSTGSAAHWLVYQIAPERFRQYVEALIGAPFATPHFATVRSAPVFRSRFRTALRAVTRYARVCPSLLESAEVSRALEEDILFAAAHLIQRDTGIEHKPARYDAGRIARKIEDYVRARSAQPVYIAELCAATGVSERTLRKVCHEVYGVSPMRYLRIVRLNQARRALMEESDSPQRVTQAGLRFGFYDLGRFASEYRALFGELPSRTRRRSPSIALHA